MGADQSKQSEAAVPDKLLERLHALNMNHDKYAQYLKEKEEYVVVDGEGEARMFFISSRSSNAFHADHVLQRPSTLPSSSTSKMSPSSRSRSGRRSSWLTQRYAHCTPHSLLPLAPPLHPLTSFC